MIQRSTGASASAQLGANGSDAILLELREQRGLRSVPKRGLIGLYHFALPPDRRRSGVSCGRSRPPASRRAPPITSSAKRCISPIQTAS